MALALQRTPDGGMEAARPAAPRVALRRIILTDMRSYAHARLDLDGRPVVLTGPNGAGKTNLLEAVSLLAPGRGLRGARLAEIDRTGAGPFAIAARVDPGDGSSVEVATGRDPERSRERRIVRVDGLPASSQAALAGIVRVIWLTPAMDQLFQDAPGERRRLLDRLVLVGDPAHAESAARYQHAIRERARLLRARRHDPTWLAMLEQRAASAGVAMAAARREAVAQLAAALADAPGTAFPRPTLALEGEVELWLDDVSALEAETRFRDLLKERRAEDAETGTTSTGPHRSDLLVSDAASGRPARLCSTGQQKALLVSIVLAEARLRAAAGGRLPVLLLDEVAAHLDSARRAELFQEILSLRAQAWLTGTDALLFRPLAGRAEFITVRASTLHRQDPVP